MTPDAALSAVAGYPGLLLLDLDETAYLQNSTEDFLDSAQPSLVALLLLRLLDLVKPWRWTGGETTRDVWRVRFVMLCLPWSLLFWRRRVTSLAALHRNGPLIDAVRQRSGETVLVTLGFEPIVRPLVTALGLSGLRLVCARLDRFADRRHGKLAMTREAFDEPTIAGCAAISDSPDDLPLLDLCAQPIYVKWPGARYRKALAQVYLPGQYLTQVKRPGQRYIVRGILQEDFAFWVLCSLSYAAMPLPHIVGLLFLLLSFWAIYERGYVDNDWVAVMYEKDPKLSDTFGRIEIATPVVLPWVWAAGSGLVAIWLLRWPGVISANDLIGWGAVLITTHLGFMVYNRVDKSSRIWLFPGLQFLRSAAFVVLVPISLPASLALGAHVLARWVPYYLYRIGGKDWPDAPFFLSRLLFYVILWLTIAITQETAEVMTPTALALLGWNMYRARSDLARMLRAMHRVDQPPSGPAAE